MFRKIKKYFTEKKDYRESKETLELILMDKLSSLAQKEIENQELQMDILSSAKDQNEEFTPEETRNFMTLLEDFLQRMEKPDFSDDFFARIQEQAGEELVKENLTKKQQKAGN